MIILIFPSQFKKWFYLDYPYDSFRDFMNLIFESKNVASTYEKYLRNFMSYKPKDIERKVFLAVQDILLKLKYRFDKNQTIQKIMFTVGLILIP